MQPKESKSSKHFKISMWKSGIRLGACWMLFWGDVAVSAILFAAAEILGIAEEL
jgi:uncharacterized membrane protein